MGIFCLHETSAVPDTTTELTASSWFRAVSSSRFSQNHRSATWFPQGCAQGDSGSGCARSTKFAEEALLGVRAGRTKQWEQGEREIQHAQFLARLGAQDARCR